MSLKGFVLFTLSVCLFTAGLLAQSGKAVIIPGVRFDQYFSSDGLPDNRVRNLFQDSRGYLWVGTMNGLCRFDGYGFKRYYKSSSQNSVSGNWASAIAEDDHSDLYIGTREGLSKFVRNTDGFVRPGNTSPGLATLSGVAVTALHFDKHKQLWLGTAKGLLMYHPTSGRLKHFTDPSLKLSISKIIHSQGDYIWIANTGGLIRYNCLDGKYREFKIDIRPNPYGDRIWSLLEDNKSLYIGTGGDGLIKLPFDAETGDYKNFERSGIFKDNRYDFAGTQVFDIVKSEKGDLWLATEGGLARLRNNGTASGYPGNVLQVYRYNALDKNSISNNIIYKLLIDRAGVLWCGTELGLNKTDLNLSAFQYYTFSGTSSADQVRSIASSDALNIYLGTASSGLFKYNISTGNSSQLRFPGSRAAHNAYRSLYIRDHILWAGTLGGILKVSPETFSAVVPEINSCATFASLKDAKGNLWIGTNRGLFVIAADGSRKSFSEVKNAPPILKNGFVRQIFEDHSGNIWLGFENGGLLVFDPAAGRFYSFSSSQPGKEILGSSILSLTEFPENVIWAGSESGLNKISLSGKGPGRYEVTHFDEEQGLPDKSVNGILASANGFLWISTIRGLARLDIEKNRLQNYLSNVNFSIGSCYKANERTFLFGTGNGFILFDPFLVTAGGKEPQVAISDLKLFNQPVGINERFNGDIILEKAISEGSEIRLNYHNNVFTIGFAALHFANPAQNLYSYKMEGFNKHWINAPASARTATYTNLDPGTYYFKVRAANYMGNWTAKPAVLKITILPPPWKTWWAIVLYVLLFNILLFIFTRYMLIQSRQRQEIEFQKIEKEQLKKLNEMKLNFFTNISHELRTPLTLITAPVEELLSGSALPETHRNKVNFIYRNCKKLLRLLDELMAFQKAGQGMLKLSFLTMDISSFLQAVYLNFLPLAERNKINLRFHNSLKSCLATFDPDKLELVINNLISNAFKFNREGGSVTLRLYADADPGFVCIAVDDDGSGIPEHELGHVFDLFYSENNKKGTGVGLALTKNLAELHGGSIYAESIPGIKTSFTVRLPLNTERQLPVAEVNYEPDSQAPEAIPELNYLTPELAGKEPADKLLIIDDNKEILDYLQMLFREKYSVIRAVNGRDALDKLNDTEPDLIISDLMMPEMDGAELCRNLKSDVKTSHIPFILLTAKGADEDKLLGLQTGADDYLPKPFHPEILKLRVEKMIASQRALIEKYRGDGVVIPKDIARNPLDEQFLNRVLSAINDNLANDEFSVEDLGNAVFMSRSHLFRKLKAITGQTPIEFIYQLRIKRSMELLLERKLSISEIAFEVGFKNPSSFTSSFKKQYGKSPKEYLNTVLKEQKS